MRRLFKIFLYALPLFIIAAVGFFLLFSSSQSEGEGRGAAAGKDSSDVSGRPLVAVDATVYRGLMQMLGVGGRCIDFSKDMKPDAEKVAASGADMLMLSMYDGLDTAVYSRMGIKIVPCRDFMEPSPLGRARWMKRYGRLWGVGEKADSLYDAVEKNYRKLSSRTKRVKVRPRVFFDLMYGSLWYQPSEKSTMGALVADAGGALPFHIVQEGGSKALSREQVLSGACDADVWIIRYQGRQKLTLDALKALDPAYSQFKAFKNGNVWACNSDETAYFDEAPFRPDYQLEDVISILHPELKHKKKLHYFSRLE
jgi:iron complex transport system substrate-binding protein